jgi:hypothetical protein
MEQELEVPVINDGLHVALGIAPLNELKRYLRSGDIVIISLEYYNFTDEISFYGLPQYLADWIEFSPDRIWDVHEPYRQLPSLYAIMLQRKVNRQLNYYLNGFSNDADRGEFTGDQFNEHGDFIGHLDDHGTVQSEISDSAYPVNNNEVGYSYLEEFNLFAISKGATVFYEAQAHRQANCDQTGKRILNRFYSRLRARTKIPLLTDLDQLCLPDEYFYDTAYHLNEQGRRIRTEYLIANLMAALTELK